MPTEPEKNIERTLNEYAQKRREQAGAPMELHPVNRKLLQDEVQRTHASGATPAPARSPFWSIFWRRLAVAGSFAALFLMVSLVWRDMHSSDVQRYSYDAPKATKPAATPAPVFDAERAKSEEPYSKDFGTVSEAKAKKSMDAQNANSVTLQLKNPIPELGASGQSAANGAPGGKSGVSLQLETKPASADQIASITVRAKSLKEMPAPGVRSGEMLSAAPPVAAPPPPPAPAKSGLVAKDEYKRLADSSQPASDAPGLKPQSARNLAELDGAKRDAARASGENSRLMKSSPSQIATANKAVAREITPATETQTKGGLAGKPASRAEGMVESESLARMKSPQEAKQAALTVAIDGTATNPMVTANTQLAFKARGGSTNKSADRADKDAQSRSYFVQSADTQQLRRNFNSPPRPPVLNSFQFEQDGDVIKVIDADGSVYTGTVTHAAAAGAASSQISAISDLSDDKKEQAESERKAALKSDIKSRFAEKLEANKAAPAPTVGEVSFHVSGLNRSIGEPVVFDGAMIATNLSLLVTNASVADVSQFVGIRGLGQNPTGTSAYSFGVNRGNLSKAGALRQQSQHSVNLIIRGRAQVGESNRLEIDALQAK